MANTSVQIPGAPAGTAADTFTVASGDHRQVVVLGSPTTDANVGEVNAQGAGLVNQPDLRSLANSLTLTSGNNVTLSGLNGQGTAAVQITGSWTGTVVFEGTVDGSTWAAIYLSQFGTANQQLVSATANGMWQAPCAGLQGVRVRCSVTGTGTATVSISASSAPHHPDGVPWRPDGWPRIAMDPTSIFTDTFETLDQVDKWNLGGANAPTISGGSLSVSAGTTANVASYIYSKPTFALYITAFENLAMVMAIEAGVVTGNKRWWGLGLTPPTVTASVPLQNGVVFEILDTDGALYGAVYSGGVRTQSVALVRPTDGGLHRYAIYYKTSRVYFELDNIQVGSIALPSPAVANLPLSIGSVNSASPPGTAAVLTSSVFGIADTGRNNTSISDPANPFRRATVKAPSTASVVTDNPLVVALHPSSPMPGVTTVAGELAVTSTANDQQLTELRRMNTYLSILTGTTVSDDDILAEGLS